MPPKRAAPLPPQQPDVRARSSLEELADRLDESLATLHDERHRREALLDEWYRRPEVMQAFVDPPIWERVKGKLRLLRVEHEAARGGEGCAFSAILTVRAALVGSDAVVAHRLLVPKSGFGPEFEEQARHASRITLRSGDVLWDGWSGLSPCAGRDPQVVADMFANAEYDAAMHGGLGLAMLATWGVARRFIALGGTLPVGRYRDFEL